jgi:hypothetical protein
MLEVLPPNSRAWLLDPRRPWADSPAIRIELRAAGLVAALVLVVWATTGAGYFWPRWVWFGVGLPLALHVAIRSGWRRPAGRARWFALQAAVTGVLAVALVV